MLDDLLSVALEVRHPGKNHHRRYTVSAGRDLFQVWTAAIQCGRIDQGGRELRFAAPTPKTSRYDPSFIQRFEGHGSGAESEGQFASSIESILD
jgi:hypothetical protein